MHQLPSNLKLKEFDVSKANQYRYTLIHKRLCFDFIVRDNQILFLGNSEKYSVFDPRIFNSDLFRIRCDFPNNTFTHFLFRTKPYLDSSNLTQYNQEPFIIIQDFNINHNIQTHFKPLPNYQDIENMFRFNISEREFEELIVKKDE